MRPPHRHGPLVVVAALALAAGCGGGGDAQPSAADGLPRGDEPVTLDPARFTAEIDNRWWPMEPGTRWTYREVDEDGGEQRVVVTATSLTRTVANGVTARVVRDTVTEDGALVEDTFDWYAQDAEGTVWYLGEDTAEFEDGALANRSGSFEAGDDGALPGVIMPADPVAGLSYRQEYYAGEAEDSGEILSTEERVEVPAGSYAGALLTKDTNALAPDVLEYKLYAAGTGPVLALGISGGGGREELVRVGKVSPAAARAAGTAPLGEPYP